MRRRGTTLLFVIGSIMVLMIFVTALSIGALERYHNAQFTQDRLQALQCAQAGAEWARRNLQVGAPASAEIQRVELGTSGYVNVRAVPELNGMRLFVEGVAVRRGESKATRMLELLIPAAGVPQ